MNILFTAEFMPMLLTAGAAIFVLIAHIFKIKAAPIFAITSVIILISFFTCFLGREGPFLEGIGLTMNMTVRLAFKVLLPALFGIGLMLYRKISNEDKKIAALLMLLISFVGGMTVLSSKNWMVFFVGIQCLSLPIYGLISFETNEQPSVNAAVKYLFLSIIAMAFLLFGIVLCYATTGDMSFSKSALNENQSLLIAFALTLIVVGIGFKTSLFPFHVWAPDLYQNASFFATSYLLIIVKAIMVLFLLENLAVIAGEEHKILSLFSALAFFSMWIGNGMMLLETSFFRLLGFLSIAHLGNLIIPLVAMSSVGNEAIFIDLTSFGFAILLVIFTLRRVSVQKNITHWRTEDLSGLFREQPWSATFLAIGLLALVGIPLTTGFIGKFAIIQSGIKEDLWFLTINLILTSILGILAIAKLLLVMLGSEHSGPRPSFSLKSEGLLAFCAFLIVFFGIFPEPWISWIQSNIQNPM